MSLKYHLMRKSNLAVIKFKSWKYFFSFIKNYRKYHFSYDCVLLVKQKTKRLLSESKKFESNEKRKRQNLLFAIPKRKKLRLKLATRLRLDSFQRGNGKKNKRSLKNTLVPPLDIPKFSFLQGKNQALLTDPYRLERSWIIQPIRGSESSNQLKNI